jgi:hypothetical protein
MKMRQQASCELAENHESAQYKSISIVLNAKPTLNSQMGGDIRQDTGKVELRRQNPESLQ